jgi:acyl-coenzyme A thioesterase PaaI-like protein
LPDSGLRKPILEAIGLAFDPARPGLARLAVRPELVNSLGAIQGGGMAILLEATAEHLAGAQLGEPIHIHSLHIHYLKLARVGPVRAEARRLARTAAGALLRVEIFDEGRQDELLTVATVGLDAGAALDC